MTAMDVLIFLVFAVPIGIMIWVGAMLCVVKLIEHVYAIISYEFKRSKK